MNSITNTDFGLLDKRVVIVPGSFAPNGSSAVSASSILGTAFSVARTSAGKFTITFNDTFNAILAVEASLQLVTADDKYMIVGEQDLTAKTLVLYVWDVSAGAATDVSANANNRIHFVVYFKNSTVTP
jgi:hypothetical protein